MRRASALFALLVLAPAARPLGAQPHVPAAPRVDVVDTYFGTDVADPYRWLEAYDTPAVRAWYEAEDAAARAFLAARPVQAHVLARYAAARAARPYALLSYAEASGWLVYRRRAPDASSASVYARSADAPERLLLAPDAVAPGAVLRYLTLSPTGEHVAVTAFVGGVESAPLVRVVETATGRVLDELPPRAGGVTWLPGGRAFLYVHYRDGDADATATDVVGGQPLLVHTLGTDARTTPDPVAFRPQDAGGDERSIAYPTPQTPSADVVFAAWATETSDRWDATVAQPAASVGSGAPWHVVSAPADSVVGIFARGAFLYAASFRGSRTGRLVRVPVPPGFPDTLAPDWSRAETVVPAGTVDFWQGAANVVYASDAIYTVETSAGQARLYRTTYEGARAEIAVPAEGVVAEPVGSHARVGVDVFVSNWTTATRRLRYTPATGLVEAPAFYNPPDPLGTLAGLTAETVAAPSHDGVGVPMTVLRGDGADGPRPTILVGYASYGHTDEPYFRAVYRPWLEAGGQVAFCHARGSGYAGPAWHEAGTRANKPNTWLDGVACAEALIGQGLAVPAHLGIQGISAGGIFVGRTVETRPDLFGAAVAEVGWSDMVRFSTGSVGPSNAHEFGSPDTEEGFRALLAMSAYHHVRDGTAYPPTLVYAAFNDSRVAPWHAAKFAAALRHAGGADARPDGARPVLLRVDFEAGHGLADTVRAHEERGAAVLAFFADRLGLRLPGAP